MEEDSGERDEREQLDMGSHGTMSTQQRPMGHFDQGFMCFETWRGLSIMHCVKPSSDFSSPSQPQVVADVMIPKGSLFHASGL